MRTKYAILVAVAVLLIAPSPRAQHDQHHAAGAKPGAIAALTAEQVQQLLDGEGMGLARAAELNGYPGPKHVFELETELQITADQRKRVEAIRQQMLMRAKSLGQQIVHAETELDAAFKAGTLSEADLESRVQAIAKLQGEVRLAHLRAHLQTRPVLTAAQVKTYYEHRGDGGEARVR
jgi:hypothetical protein